MQKYTYFGRIYLIKIFIYPIYRSYTCIHYDTLVVGNIISSKIVKVLNIHILKSPLNGELERSFVPSIRILPYIAISYFP